MTEQFANNASSTLNGGINASVTSIVITSVTGFPTTGNFRCMIGSNASTGEIIIVQTVNVGTNTFTTVLRGQEGTTAQTWTSGTVITHILTAGGLAAGTTGGGDLSGSVQNATVAKVNAVSYPSGPSTNTVPVVTSSNTITYQTIADAQVSSSAAIAGTKISPNFGTQSIVTTGSATLGAVTSTSLSTSLITNSGKEVYSGISAPTVSGSGQGSLYFDSATNAFLISQNAGNYIPLVGNTQIKNSAYTILISDGDIYADLSSSAWTLTLPSSPNIGEKHIIKDYKGNAGTNNLTISGNGKTIEQFGGTGTASTLILNSNYDAVILGYNGTNWSIL